MLKNLLVRGALSVLSAAYAIFLLCYFVPGMPGGVDQNAYHVFARNIADDGHFYRNVNDEFEYVGAMWVQNDRKEFFPKYPPGYPALIAAANELFGNGAGFYLTVAGAVLTIPGIYCVSRFFMPQLFALLAAWMMAFSPMLAHLGLARNSHTPSLALFLWGLAAFLWAAHSRKYRYSVPLAVLGGLLIGFCTGVRYTDFLLIAVPGVYALFYFRRRRFWILCSALALGAAIPYGAIAYFHHWAFGSIFISGYGLTGEDSAFDLSSMMLNLRLYLPDIMRDGVGPVAILMFALLLRPAWRRWRRALFWMVWILPTLCLYMTYYWAPDGRSASYLRFLMPLLPAFYILGAGGLKAILRKRSSLCIFLAVCGVALIQLVWGLPGIINLCETKSLDDRKLAQNVNCAKANIPPGSVIISTEQILNELDFERKNLLYPLSLLNAGQINRITEQTLKGEAIWLQRSRAEELKRLFGKMKQGDLDKFFIERFKTMLKDGKRVFFYASTNDSRRLRNVFRNHFELKEHVNSPSEVPSWVFLSVNSGSNRYGKPKPTQKVTVMELWELAAARVKAQTESEREESLQQERNELVRLLGDEGGERSQMLTRLESTLSELNNLRWNRNQREAAAKAKAEQEKKAKEKLEKDKAEQEKKAKEKLEKDKAEQEKKAKEKLEKDKVEQEKKAKEKLEKDKVEQDKKAGV